VRVEREREKSRGGGPGANANYGSQREVRVFKFSTLHFSRQHCSFIYGDNRVQKLGF